jgi:undecaprenyl-diphosphatase
VEGITKFLPTEHRPPEKAAVSSTRPGVRSHVAIQFGAILSVIVYFRERLFPPAALQDATVRHRTLDLWSKSVVAVIPALGLGAAFGEAIESRLYDPRVVGVMLLVGGIVLILVERRRSVARIDDMAGLSFRVALAIGLIQCLAMIPGTSRSAATIIGAMALGCSRRVAAEFSFFLAIPTMLARRPIPCSSSKPR